MRFSLAVTVRTPHTIPENNIARNCRVEAMGRLTLSARAASSEAIGKPYMNSTDTTTIPR